MTVCEKVKVSFSSKFKDIKALDLKSKLGLMIKTFDSVTVVRKWKL